MGENWRDVPLEDEILIKTIHAFILKKFRSSTEVFPKATDGRQIKSQDDKADGKNKIGDLNEDDEEESYEDENKWLCDGSNKFIGGCKSRQTEFDYHEGTGWWTSSN